MEGRLAVATCRMARQVPSRTGPGCMGILQTMCRKTGPILKVDASTKTRRNVRAAAGAASRNSRLLRPAGSCCNAAACYGGGRESPGQVRQETPAQPVSPPWPRRHQTGRRSCPGCLFAVICIFCAIRAEAPRHQPRHVNPLYAALDLGTNNCRLLVASPRVPASSV